MRIINKIFVENLSLEDNAVEFLGISLQTQILCMTPTNFLLYKQNSIHLNEKIIYTCNIQNLRNVILFIFHSLDDYGIIFWGKTMSMCKIFLTQKRYPEIRRKLIPVPVGTGLRNWRF